MHSYACCSADALHSMCLLFTPCDSSNADLPCGCFTFDFQLYALLTTPFPFRALGGVLFVLNAACLLLSVPLGVSADIARQVVPPRLLRCEGVSSDWVLAGSQAAAGEPAANPNPLSCVQCDRVGLVF